MDPFDSQIKDLLGLAGKKDQDAKEQIRIEQAELLYTFYKNDAHNIIYEIIKRMARQFTPDTIESIPAFCYTNPLPKVLKNHCMAYNKPAKRSIQIGKEISKTETDAYLNLVKQSKLERKIIEIYKLGKLFNKILVMPTFFSEDQTLRYDILFPQQIRVEVDDIKPEKINKLACLDSYFDKNGEFHKRVKVWTEDEYYWVDENGNEHSFIENKPNDFTNIIVDKNGKNIIPVVQLSFGIDEYNFWGYSEYEQIIEHALSDSIQDIWVSFIMPYLTGSIPVLTNYEAAGEETNEADKSKADYLLKIGDRYVLNSKYAKNKNGSFIKISPGQILRLNQNMGAQPVTFDYKTPVSNINDIDQYVNNKRKKLLNDHSLSANASATEVIPESGYSKMVSEKELLEMREQDIPILRDFEYDLFEMTKNVTLSVNKRPIINPKAVLVLNYREIKPLLTAQEEKIKKDTAFLYNEETPIDWIMENDPDIDRETAEKKYQENIAINKKQSDTLSLSENDIQQENPQQENNLAGQGKGSGSMFDFPDLRQHSDYDCGVLLDVLEYYGEDMMPKEMEKEMGTTENGTSPEQIKTFFENHGYQVDMREMTIEEVKQYLDKYIPVVLDIQAWSDTENVDYANDWIDGHYVVAHGYDSNYVYFDDPSSVGLAGMTYEDLEIRWHDVDGNGNQLQHLGIAIFGKEPDYSQTKMVEIG